MPPVFNARILADAPNREETVFRSKAVGEPPLMLAISVWLAIRDAIASVADHKRAPHLDAPATPERVLHGGGCDQGRMIMLRLLLTLLACAAFTAPAFAQSEPVKPASTSDVGPWEAVIWTRGKLVHRCTLSRARNAPEGLSYGFLIDREGILLGVTNKNFAFKSEAPQQATLAPQSGAHRSSPRVLCLNIRANIELPKPLLDALQRSEHADVQIGRTKSRGCRSTISTPRGWCWKSACRSSERITAAKRLANSRWCGASAPALVARSSLDH